MKVTKHLLEQFIALEGVSKERLLEELNKIGLEVESFCELKVPDGVVVGKVLSKEKHKEADKLNITQVDVGDRILQIVCGASNVKEGQWVAVALEGARLETPKGELTIAKAKLRGVESYGMICSSVELGFPKLGEGIMVLDESIGALKKGQSLNSYPVFNNFVIELGLTPNRGDCLSVLGVARDLSVALDLPLRLKNYRDENTVLGIGRVLQVVNENNFSSSVLYKVARLDSLSPSLEISLSLALCDLPLQSSLEDFLNFAMHNIGVILRAYPFEFFTDSQRAEISLRQEKGVDFICAQGGKIAVGISPNIQEIKEGLLVLEASFIDPSVVSELIYEHKDLPKDAFITYRTTRGSNPDLVLGMQYLCELLIDLGNVEVYSSSHSVLCEKQNKGIKTTFDAIHSIIGEEIPKEEMTNLLKKIGFSIEASCDDTFFMAFPPLHRHDLQSVQDVSEEILRFLGIENIQSKPLVFREKSLRECKSYFDFKQKRNLFKRAAALGFCESLHYVFCDRKRLEELGFEALDENLDVLNPITNELNTLRPSLLPSMLESIERNENLGFRAIAFCESGVCYSPKREQIQKIAFAVNLVCHIEAFPHPKGEEWDFYSFARSVSDVVGGFELEAIEEGDALTLKLLHPYQSAWVMRDGKRIGFIGKLNPKSGFEGFVCEALLEPLICQDQKEGVEFSKFQASTRDMTVMIDQKFAFARVKAVIDALRVGDLREFYPLDVYKQESFGPQVALSLRFIFQSLEKTLQEEDLNQGMTQILKALEENFGASLRQ